MFLPRRCPNPRCREHRFPRPGFFYRHGSYKPKCRPQPVPRFLCRSCRRGFSRQTFRADYRDHRPDLNVPLFNLLTSGVGLRQCSRLLRLSRRCTELKFRKLARQLGHLERNLRRPLPPGSHLQLDELETYEGARRTRPLSVPLLIEVESRFWIWAESAPIRPRGRMSPARRLAIAAEELRLGPRRDRSRRSVLRTLRRGAELCRRLDVVQLSSDEKPTYPALARRAFAGQRLVHRRTSSLLPRTVENPLFAINHTEAMARDLMGRLRRKSWLASKRGWCLDLHLQMYAAYRNWARPRFNRDKEPPGQILGFVDRPLRKEQLLGWRQDWGRRSVHPLSRGGHSVEQWPARARRA